jgi:hypothetical protein
LLRDDPDAKVRLQAVLALANLEYTGSENLTLSPRLTNALANAYERAQDGTVRNEIITTLALTNSDHPARDRARSKALSDVSLGAVQPAVMGLANSRNAAGLPRIAHLRAAAAAETDSLVRQTLEKAIASVARS